MHHWKFIEAIESRELLEFSQRTQVDCGDDSSANSKIFYWQTCHQQARIDLHANESNWWWKRFESGRSEVISAKSQAAICINKAEEGISCISLAEHIERTVHYQCGVEDS